MLDGEYLQRHDATFVRRPALSTVIVSNRSMEIVAGGVLLLREVEAHWTYKAIDLRHAGGIRPLCPQIRKSFGNSGMP